MSQPDFNEIMAQAQKMQEQFQSAQEELAQSTVVGEAGNGLVKLTMSGSGEVSDVTLDPSVVDKDDVETLQDLIMGAFQNANQQLVALAEEKMGPLSQLDSSNPFGLGG